MDAGLGKHERVGAPTRAEILRFCFFGDGRRSPLDRLAVVAAWCVAIAVLSFNASFPLLFSDGNLLIRAVGTLVLSAPMLGLYVRGKRSLMSMTRTQAFDSSSDR